MNRYVNNEFDLQSFHTIGVEFLNKDIVVEGQMLDMAVDTWPDSHSLGSTQVHYADMGYGGTGAVQVASYTFLSRYSCSLLDRTSLARTVLDQGCLFVCARCSPHLLSFHLHR